MANIKISELNELEQVDNDDLLVIVDTSANETKKVKARNVGTGGGGSDIVIISDTQPTSEDNKIWINTGEVGESFTEITNEYSTSTGKGYSANYINGLHTYSTQEQRIGTWIDGKPLYRKTFYITSNLSSPLDIQHNIQNVDYMKVEGHLTTSTTSTPPFYATTTDYFRVFRNQNLLSARYGTGITASSITFIVEYTKTTD